MEKRRVTTPMGEIEYCLTRRRVKNINLRIRPGDLSIQVSAAPRVSLGLIDGFVRDNYSFIFKHLERLKSQKPSAVQAMGGSLEQGDCILLLGKATPIRLIADPANLAEFNGNEIILRVADINNYPLKYNIMEGLLCTLRKQVYQAALDRWYKPLSALGFAQPQLIIKPSVSRWGYCKPQKGLIMMNTALIHLHPGLIDYLALHELCHMVHPNHSPEYWGLMCSLMPDCKARRKAMKGYSLLTEK